MLTNNDNNQNSSPGREIAKVTNLSRRSFLIKGAVTAPILASFVHKPVWAVNDNCISSGSLSGNLSNHHCSAVARSVQWWIDASYSLWPNEVYLNAIQLIPSSKFKSVFLCKPLRFTNNTYHRINSDGTPKLDSNQMPILRSIDNSGQSRALRYVMRKGAAVDKQLVAAVLNCCHTGIAYDGYSDVTTLLADYNNVIDSYLIGVKNGQSQTSLNGLFDQFTLGLSTYNTDNDAT